MMTPIGRLYVVSSSFDTGTGSLRNGRAAEAQIDEEQKTLRRLCALGGSGGERSCQEIHRMRDSSGSNHKVESLADRYTNPRRIE